MTEKKSIGGSKYLYEAFDCEPAKKLDANDRMMRLQLDSFMQRLDRIEEMIVRLDKRLWLIAFGVVGAVLTQVVKVVLPTIP